MNTRNTLAVTLAVLSIASSCTRSDKTEAALPPEQQSAFKPAAAPMAAAPVNKTSPVGEPVAKTNPPVRPAEPAVAPAPPKPVAKPQTVTIPAGSVIAVRTGESISSETNTAGDTWTGTLSAPLVVNGLVIAERGSAVSGRVMTAKRAGKVKGNANLTIALTSLQTADGQRVNVHTGSYGMVGKDTTKRDAAKIGILTGIGAAVGAIVDKGKGAAIGAGSGAAAGTGVVLMTRGGEARIPAETLISFRTVDAVTVTEK